MVKKLGHWVRDYIYLTHKQSQAFIFRKPPIHYLGHVDSGKPPIILIPGLFEKWHFLQAIADPLSLKGHPVYVLEHLKYNSTEISLAAKLVRELIEEKNLKEVTLIAHSKGGLIGKYLLTFYNKDERVKKLISIASPFAGSAITNFFRHKTIKELSPNSDIIKDLHKEKKANSKITSIYGVFDNHVWPGSSCHLEGAENIKVDVYGHHKILNSKRVIDIVMNKVEEIV